MLFQLISCSDEPLNIDAFVQVLIFVHARNATVKTAKEMIRQARQHNEISLFSACDKDGYSLVEKQVRKDFTSLLHLTCG